MLAVFGLAIGDEYDCVICARPWRLAYTALAQFEYWMDGPRIRWRGYAAGMRG
jgi:hypothetical protein